MIGMCSVSKYGYDHRVGWGEARESAFHMNSAVYLGDPMEEDVAEEVPKQATNHGGWNREQWRRVSMFGQHLVFWCIRRLAKCEKSNQLAPRDNTLDL